MQKVNVDVHIWNELRSNDQFGLNTPPIFLQFYPLAFRYHSVTILYFPNSLNYMLRSAGPSSKSCRAWWNAV